MLSKCAAFRNNESAALIDVYGLLSRVKVISPINHILASTDRDAGILNRMGVFKLPNLPDPREQASCEAPAHWQSIVQTSGVASPIGSS